MGRGEEERERKRKRKKGEEKVEREALLSLLSRFPGDQTVGSGWSKRQSSSSR